MRVRDKNVIIRTARFGVKFKTFISVEFGEEIRFKRFMCWLVWFSFFL